MADEITLTAYEVSKMGPAERPDLDEAITVLGRSMGNATDWVIMAAWCLDQAMLPDKQVNEAMAVALGEKRTK